MEVLQTMVVSDGNKSNSLLYKQTQGSPPTEGVVAGSRSRKTGTPNQPAEAESPGQPGEEAPRRDKAHTLPRRGLETPGNGGAEGGGAQGGEHEVCVRALPPQLPHPSSPALAVRHLSESPSSLPEGLPSPGTGEALCSGPLALAPAPWAPCNITVLCQRRHRDHAYPVLYGISNSASATQ